MDSNLVFNPLFRVALTFIERYFAAAVPFDFTPKSFYDPGKFFPPTIFTLPQNCFPSKAHKDSILCCSPAEGPINSECVLHPTKLKWKRGFLYSMGKKALQWVFRRWETRKEVIWKSLRCSLLLRILAFTNPTQKEFMLLGRRELLLLPRRPHARNYGHFPRFHSRNTLLLPTIQINSSLTTFVPCFSRLELNLLFHFPALQNLLMLWTEFKIFFPSGNSKWRKIEESPKKFGF